MQLSFHGAAGEVTGSCNLLEAAGHKILVDCGMFQGGQFNEEKNQDKFIFDPAGVSAVVVTHAHLDHVGRLPLLIKEGFTGFIYATPPTVELARLILEDAFEIMTYNHRHFNAPVLYDLSDIGRTMEQFKPLDYHTVSEIVPGIKIEFYDAGHIFGSAFVRVESEGKQMIFSGDIGNVNVPILRDTEMASGGMDAIVCESTYGDRLHESTDKRQALIEKMVSDAIRRGGVLMIPSFSLERTQELLYDLNDLVARKKRLPRVPIFLDSPLAIKATQVYRKYHQYYDEEATRLFNDGDDLFEFPGLEMTETKEQSKRINETRGPKIIIAGAGMMNGGRIIHHALRYLSDEKNTLLIIGYQAVGTLGRKILEGESPVEVMGERVRVRCQIKAIGALSAHGDQDKLLDWLGGETDLPKKIFLNHGEPPAAQSLAARLQSDLGLKATIAEFGLQVEI